MAGGALSLALLLTLAVTLASVAGLRAWRQWLELKRIQIATPRTRAEIGEMRRRVRRLEALANGIEL